MIIRIDRQAEDPVRSLVPDLALSGCNSAFVPEYRRFDVTVHNVGAEVARSFDVAPYSGDRFVDRKRVPHLPAPDSLVPSTVRLGFQFVPGSSKGRFTGRIDEEDLVDEIVESNNVAEAELATPLMQRKRRAHP